MKKGKHPYLYPFRFVESLVYHFEPVDPPPDFLLFLRQLTSVGSISTRGAYHLPCGTIFTTWSTLQVTCDEQEQIYKTKKER